MVKIYYCDIWKETVFELNRSSYCRYGDHWVHRVGGLGFRIGVDGYGMDKVEFNELEEVYKQYVRERKLERICSKN